jgi:hypothetical protein
MFLTKHIRLSRLTAITLALLICAPFQAAAVDGYDQFNHTRISIIAGDKIAIGEDLGVYIWKEQRFAAVEVENVLQRGEDLEIEVTERKTNKYFFFEIASDDPGLSRLPEFDPGLPFPEVLTPELHMKHDLLDARGNMLERGNRIERGDQINRQNMIDGQPQLGDERLLSGDHLLYQGFHPVE